MKKISATTEKARETAAMVYGIPGTNVAFKLGSVPCTFEEDDVILVILPTFILNKIVNAIEISKTGIIINYKDKINMINDILKTAGIDKNIRHKIERELIRVWGGHEHFKHIRRIFL